MGRLILWIIIAAFAIFWAMTVYKTCNNTDNPLSKAKTSIEDTFEDSGLSSNDAEISDADLDEFEGEEEEDATTENNGYATTDEADATAKAEEASPSTALDDERPKSYDSSAEANDNGNSSSTQTAAATKPPASSATTAPSVHTTKYMVVAGSFKSKSYAASEVRRLKNLGYPEAELVKFDRTAYHSVCAGRYNNLAKARARATALKKDGVDAYVHRRRGRGQ